MIRGAVMGSTFAIATAILTAQYIPEHFVFVYGVALGMGMTQVGILVEEWITGV